MPSSSSPVRGPWRPVRKIARTNTRPTVAPGQVTACCQGVCGGSEPTSSPLSPLAGAHITRLHITQMDCPVEERLIRKQLQQLVGVGELQFDLLSRILQVEHAPEALPEILQAIRDLGFTPQHNGEPQSTATQTRYPAWLPLGMAGGAALGAELSHWLWPQLLWLSPLLALLTLLLCGTTTYRKGWLALRHRDLNIHALMTLAVSGALALGQWPEAAMVLFLFAVAERLESASLTRANQAITSLLKLAPNQALLVTAEGRITPMPVSEVAIGAHIRILPGSQIPLDGLVVKGRSSVDESSLTGESLPVEKGAGARLYAGTLNQQGELECQVTSLANDSTLARIIRAVESARQSKAPIQQTIDSFARLYTPLVMGLALLMALLPPLLFDGSWSVWLYRALVVLVIACPCALVIATPVTLLSALAWAARQGIVIRGGAYLEQMARLKVLALDKTGTLSQGRPSLREVNWGPATPQQQAAWLSCAVTLAQRSHHPLAQAIAGHFDVPPVTFDELNEQAGLGMSASQGQHRYLLGSRRWLDELGVALEAMPPQASTSEVLLARHDSQGYQLLAQFCLHDPLKSEAQSAMTRLQQQGITLLILSGDQPALTQRLAQQFGIALAHGGLRPEQKQALIMAQQQQLAGRGTVGMVGDGVNDAPALAQADVGIAMGLRGSDTAIETAPITLLSDDLHKLPQLVSLSRRTLRVLKQNILLALGIKAAFLLLTLLGMGSLWLAVFADMGTSLLVIGNGLRLLRHRELNASSAEQSSS